MKVGVISDTHGNLEAVKKALTFIGDSDVIIHAGDVLYHPPRLGFTEGYDLVGTAELLNSLSVPLLIAQGNCDAPVYEELLRIPLQYPYAYTKLDKTGFIASHGHIFKKSELIGIATRFGASYAITGHTHLPSIKIEEGVVMMNPGSPAVPKYEIDGHPVPSIGIIDDNGARIICIDDGSVVMQL